MEMTRSATDFRVACLLPYLVRKKPGSIRSYINKQPPAMRTYLKEQIYREVMALSPAQRAVYMQRLPRFLKYYIGRRIAAEYLPGKTLIINQ
ncbi:hypothetical protein [Spartinivicinus ruber]|uniref:hypothetical protein n=1 Tax=Spartinivicinus ruber TaxID=2683272 RepID=UPI0013D255C3|nr:hypothetical protein [Spartinivicinus ruber]